MTQINLDGNTLNQEQMHWIRENEKLKLVRHFEVYHQDTLPFLSTEVCGEPSRVGQDGKYALEKPIPEVQLTKSERKEIDTRPPLGRAEFVVPLGTGPLCKDPVTERLKTTGYFRREEGSLV